ncbi:MAG: substrate-binding domain-containing protein [Cypionkella sp.]|nr:substrate-binding domain-containing protein [Cypionkella sp.]
MQWPKKNQWPSRRYRSTFPRCRACPASWKAWQQKNGVAYQVLDPKFDPVMQSQQLQTLIETRRINGAWAIVIAEPPMVPAIEAAIRNEVALVVSGRPAFYGFDGPQPGIAFSAIDYSELGGALGGKLAECLNERAVGGKVFEFIETGANAELIREFGIQTLTSNSKAEIEIVNQTDVRDPVQAQQQVLAALQANPDIAGVYALNDEQTLGAVTAFESAGIDVPCIVTSGGGDEVKRFHEEGKVYSYVGFDFAGDAIQNFQTLLKMMDNPTEPGPILNIPLVYSN